MHADMAPLPALEPFVRTRPTGETLARCELCAGPIADRHAHVVEIAAHAVRCACSACAVLFRDPGAGGGRYRTVSDRVVAAELGASAEAWTTLGVPVRLAFFVRGSGDASTAFYPSPAGPVESPLDDGAEGTLRSLTPIAATLEPHIEGLLVRRERDGTGACFIVPIDVCYELVALVRASWRGFDGGDDARAKIDQFFARLAARAEGAAR
jgi:hypothetical protein